jgi:hypothetical protein
MQLTKQIDRAALLIATLLILAICYDGYVINKYIRELPAMGEARR